MGGFVLCRDVSRRCLQVSGCELGGSLLAFGISSGIGRREGAATGNDVVAGGVVDAMVMVTMDVMLERADHRPECSSASACKFCKSTTGPIIWHTLHLMFSLRDSCDLSYM